METPVEEFTGSSEQNPSILKGKRTKRQRPFSPFGGAAATSSSCSGGVGGGGGGYYSNPSPSTSGDFSTTTEEEEDMANCLILLAQGGGQREVEQEGKSEKLSSRRFSEPAPTASAEGKTGFFVYECKTCNRTFPSFQALGGHRASHKKPKTMAEDKKVPTLKSSQDHDRDSEGLMIFSKISQPVSPPMANKPPNGNTRPKVHECSICGTEFSSGQALGGHMRRHRTAASTQIAMNIEIDTDTNAIRRAVEEDKPRHVLSLDLNLPAPLDDDHHREPNFQFRATQQHLVFSSPALVDCHY